VASFLSKPGWRQPLIPGIGVQWQLSTVIKMRIYFGIGPRGEVGLSLAINGRWEIVASEAKIALKKWSHVAATYNQKSGIRLFIDGQLVKEAAVTGKFIQAKDKDLIIGMNYEKLPV